MYQQINLPRPTLPPALRGTVSVEANTYELLARLCDAIELRETLGYAHGVLVGHLAQLLAERAGLPQELADRLLVAAPLHDIGKIAIPDAILIKPGALDAEERRIINTHAELGGTILAQQGCALLSLASEIAFHHHERWDGTGYPHRLASGRIPLSARVVAIVDVFDALLSVRPYKPAWPAAQVRAYMAEQGGTAFDPGLLDIFMADFDEMLGLRQEVAEDWQNL